MLTEENCLKYLCSNVEEFSALIVPFPYILPSLYFYRHDAALSLDRQSILLSLHSTSIGNSSSCWLNCFGYDTGACFWNCGASANSTRSSSDAGTDQECRKHILFNRDDFLGHFWYHWRNEFHMLV